MGHSLHEKENESLVQNGDRGHRDPCAILDYPLGRVGIVTTGTLEFFTTFSETLPKAN
jgi:hypothetical protein